MKVRYSPNPRIEIEVEADNQKEMFKQLASAHEVLGEAVCGNCKSDDVHFRVRNVTPKEGPNRSKTFTYFEMVCSGCGFYLPYGQHQQGGTLFPNRTVDGSFDRKNLGWRKFVKDQEGNEGS